MINVNVTDTNTVIEVKEKRRDPWYKFMSNKLPPRGEVSYSTSPIWRYCACQERTTEHQIASLDQTRHVSAYRCVQCGKRLTISL